jgi:hypothetical protein
MFEQEEIGSKIYEFQFISKAKEFIWKNKRMLTMSQCENNFNENPSYAIKISNNGLITVFNKFPQTELECLIRACEFILKDVHAA